MKPPYDRILWLALLALLSIGLLMVTSASMPVAEKHFGLPFYYFFRQGLYILLGMVALFVVSGIPLKFWQQQSKLLLGVGLFLLILVLVPGIGREINGSIRWVGFGPIGLQVSELAKFAMIIYLASYLVDKEKIVRTKLMGFIIPMGILSIIALLLLKEPDFGAAVVIMITALAMMYLGGMRVWQFLVLFALIIAALGILAISSPYRMLRLTSFLNPWAHQFDSGYQLTQSLMAFGRGGLFGVGLGGSIQKLFYLPEAHTDFLFAVLGEELGLIGMLGVIALYIILIAQILTIGRRAESMGQKASAYMAYGFGIWFAIQVAVNIGVNSGLLPTKGLTLPFMSYGGSSMVILFIAMGIIFRIDSETKQYYQKSKSKRFGW